MDRVYLRALAIASFIGHTLLGIGLFISLGTVSSSPAWMILEKITPPFIWPLLFVIVGLLALAGYCNTKYLAYSFFLGAGIMVAWGIATFVSWIIWGLVSPSAIWLIYVGVLKLTLANSIQRTKQVAALIEDAKTPLER